MFCNNNRKGCGFFEGYQAFWIIVVIAIVIIWVHYSVGGCGCGNNNCGCGNNECGCGCNNDCTCGCNNTCNTSCCC